jgi:hypothetical protein
MSAGQVRVVREKQLKRFGHRFTQMHTDATAAPAGRKIIDGMGIGG